MVVGSVLGLRGRVGSDFEKGHGMSATVEATKPLTPADLLAMPDDGKRYELVDGELVALNVSTLSSLVASRLGRRLGNHCEPTGIAWVLGADNGYQCFPDRPNKVRKPDVSAILCERLPIEKLDDGFTQIAPDIAVEVISPNDNANDVDKKVKEYLAAGVRLIWIVYPESQTVLIRRTDGTGTFLQATDELTGETVLPGFRCLVGDLFPA